MKTISDISTAIKNLSESIQLANNSIDKIPREDKSKYIKQMKRNLSELEFARFIKKYLETNPRESFCIDEAERIKVILEKRQAQYEVYVNSIIKPDAEYSIKEKIRKKEKIKFEKLHGVDKLKKQLKTLKYLLA